MQQHRSEDPRAVGSPIASRRAVVKSVLALGGAAALSPGMLAVRGSAAQESTPVAVPEPFAGETFVGEAGDGETHVAVVIAPGAAGSDREARIYLCDGQARNIWLPGTTTGDTLEIAEEAAQLRATVAGSGVSGEATLADGATLTFDAPRAEGVAGLYEVVVANQRLEGRGGDGQRLQGVVAGELSNGQLVIAAVIALADDTVHAIGAIATSDLAGEVRIITLPGGKPAGGPRLVQGVSQGSGVISQDIGLAVPEEGDFVFGQNLGL